MSHCLHRKTKVWLSKSFLMFGFTLTLCPASALAGGPKYIAGSSYFDPAVIGQPVHWRNGALNYYVDQGPLNASVSNAQAVAMVDAAAAIWSAVPTAGVTLTDKGTLNEDVSGLNTVAGNKVFAAPSDMTPSATNYPVGVVFDTDGSVTDALFGTGASDPTSCQFNGVWFWMDGINTDATVSHAVILVNGRCAGTASQLTMIGFELERAFGRILGLGYSQVNDGAATNGMPNGTQGWPVMQPISGACGNSGGNCIPNPTQLRLDDIAALNRIYPITATNLSSFPGKELTAANTASISGTLKFRTGVGMQGVNVVARPLDANGNPLYEYTITAVSGATFRGKHGNPVTGWQDSSGVPYSKWGGTDPSQQGFFDLSYMPLPPGMTTATYQITFEAINPLYIMNNAVGPYVDGSPSPSGTMPTLTVTNMTPGSTQTLDVPISDSAATGSQDAIATENSPRPLPQGGLWTGRIGQVEQTDWFLFPVRANRTFTLVTQALNENGIPSNSRAMPSLGVWDALDTTGSPAVGWVPGFNGFATGESWLQVSTASDDIVRIGIADLRGDGRPDYLYTGWLLYADTVQPEHLPLGGGPIVIRGTGFRSQDTVTVGGRPAVVTSISPTEITAIAPAVTAAGSADVEVDDLPLYSAAAIITGGISYDAGTGDSLTLVTAPSNTVSVGVPLPFSVQALNASLVPASGVTVTYSVTSGSATLGCGSTVCSVTATGDGLATMTVTALNTSPAVVTASLTNNASLQAHFTGGSAPVLTALTPFLSVATGASVNWTTEAIVLNNGTPVSGQMVAWDSNCGCDITVQGGSTSTSSSSGIATKMLTASPRTEGVLSTATACVNGTANCADFTVLGARPEFATVKAVSGTTQSVAVSSTPSQIVLRVHDLNGNPMAGGTVTLYQSLYAWAPPCPPHGRCTASPLLATQVSTATSDNSGLVVFTPASIPGVATNTVATATTGNASSLPIAIEIHP
ncbi:MAG: IPT/TIG domain-containing protein [Acidobacteriota bacterium]|nr:IPT/TIG domain-containing protein [Acidobacteriota bacterium]